MSIASRLLKNVVKKASTKVMDRVGGRLVSGMADTSADAPDARFEPKRNLYEQMQKGEVDAAGRKVQAAGSGSDADDHDDHDDGHDHGHSHSHGHDHSHDH